MLMRTLVLMRALMWKTPEPYGLFHALMAGLAVLSALGAWRLRGLKESRQQKLLFCLGVLLGSGEVLKQVFRFLIVDQGVYNWWYFPFQLCSVPMYLCLILPFAAKFGRKWERLLCTFMYCYNLPGSILVFAAPYGMMHPYWSLTIHSFMWHILLVFIGLLIAFSGMGSVLWKGFTGSTGLFLACCGIATAVNILAGPYGYPDMFYITPYYPTTQPFFSTIAEQFGIMAGDLAYIAAIIMGAFILHLIYRRYHR